MIALKPSPLALIAALILFAPLQTSAQQNSNGNSHRQITGEEALWWQEGRKIFTTHCKSCHYRDNTVGAPFLHAEAKTQKGWDRVFARRYPACAKNGAWDSLSAKQLRDLNDFLSRHAYGTSGVYESRFG